MAARGKPVIAATGRSAMDASDRSGDLGKRKREGERCERRWRRGLPPESPVFSPVFSLSLEDSEEEGAEEEEEEEKKKKPRKRGLRVKQRLQFWTYMLALELIPSLRSQNLGIQAFPKSLSLTFFLQGEYNLGIMNDLFGDGIFATDGDKWRHQRKLASHEFSTKFLRDFSTNVFRVNAAKLVSKITVATAAMETIDMQDMLMKSTLDSMFKVGFGMELNALSGSYDLGQQFARAFDDANSITFRRFVDMTWKLKRIFNIGWEANLKQNMKVIDAFIYKLIERKREQMSNGETLLGKEDILSRFLLESEKDQENMTDKYLRDITLNFIIAGKDTTANSLTWFFYSLCKHPLVQEKVAQEVREAATANQNGEVTSAEEFVELLTQEALDKMHYLHAALTETLRLYPAVPLVMKHSSSEFSAIQGIGWIPVIKWRILVHLEGLSNFK
ncbi:unnamed protein product [Linum tenue]|uniref:Cytochrome P450 n=1 Tax=Linum tenue TaxID=586396 RepID=A0AAV0HT01_9ROSI|nr:unnamed protein product [Linum tenue]